MSGHFRKGAKVKWKWGEHVAHGTIAERFTARVTRTIKGTKVTRQASEQEPAYLVKQDDGDRALKSQSELTAS
jgi:hypothetical protein